MTGQRRLRVALFGPLRLDIEGRELGPADLGGRKPKQVLEILLAHQGEPVTKERIADLVWGEALPRDPMRTLEAYVSGVRARLHADPRRARELLRSDPGAYRFPLTDAEVDLWRFDDLLDRAARLPLAERLALRERALGLVRGELLADEPYAEWVFALRDLYAERNVEALLDAGHDCVAAGLPHRALDYAERVLAAQPTRERGHRLVMAARYALGDQDLALRAYDQCREVLAEQLGVGPLPATERVYLAVLNQEPLEQVLGESTAIVFAPGSGLAERPRTRFARSGDASIAYQVIGDGPIDLVLVLGWFSHVEVGWEEPRYAAFLGRLAVGRRLILFDRRGVGMSDPAPLSVTLDERADDIGAVMDAVGSERAVVFGISVGGPMAVSLAARSPERVAGLVLYSSFGRLMAAPDYPWGWSPEFLELYQESLEEAWTTGRGIELAMPAATADEPLVEWIARFLRLSASPATARALLQFGATTDVREELGLVRAPTLVLHRSDEQWVHPDNGRFVASHIPGARFVELPGADHWPWLGDAESVLRAVEGFLAELAP